MKKEIGAGIWGAGWVSTEHLAAWNNNPHSRIVAMGSRRKEQVEERLAQAGVEGVEVYTDLDEMLGRKDLDAVSICMPADLQADAGIRAAEAGKHVCMEKPVATTPEELRRIRDAVKKAGVRTVTSFVLRWNPMVEIIARLISEDWFGKIIYSRFAYLHEMGDWYSGYGWARTKKQGKSVTLLGGCHAVDAMLFLLKKKVIEVSAFSARGHRDDFEYDPTIAGVMRFEDGTLAHITVSQELHMPYTFPMELMGSKGAVRDNRIWSDKLAGQKDWATVPSILPDSGDVSDHPFQNEIDHFVECILEDRESHASVENTAHSHEVVFALDRSAEQSGMPVSLPLAE